MTEGAPTAHEVELAREVVTLTGHLSMARAILQTVLRVATDPAATKDVLTSIRTFLAAIDRIKELR